MKNQVMRKREKKNPQKEKEIKIRHQTSRKVHGRLGVYHASPEDERQSQLKDTIVEEALRPYLRTSWRTQKPNPTYANATLVEGPHVKEPTSFKKACQKILNLVFL